MKAQRICAVIVTYNRKALLIECLEALLAQTHKLDHIVIVNNASTDGTSALLALPQLQNISHITLINLETNQGGAGGFYEGIKYAYEKHFDYIWLMDDDGIADKHCLSHLMVFAGINNYIGPLVLNKQNKEELTFSLRLPNSNNVIYTLDDVNKASHNHLIQDIVMPFNGVLFHRELVKKIGFPRKEFFIWGDDIEYTWRARKYQFNIFTVTQAKFYHPKEETLGTPMLFRLLRFNDTQSKLKLYCMCRNNIRNLLDYKNIVMPILFSFKVIWFYLFTRPNLTKLKLSCKAILDGLRKDFSHHKDYLK